MRRSSLKPPIINVDDGIHAPHRIEDPSPSSPSTSTPADSAANAFDIYLGTQEYRGQGGLDTRTSSPRIAFQTPLAESPSTLSPSSSSSPTRALVHLSDDSYPWQSHSNPQAVRRSSAPHRTSGHPTSPLNPHTQIQIPALHHKAKRRHNSTAHPKPRDRHDVKWQREEFPDSSDLYGIDNAGRIELSSTSRELEAQIADLQRRAQEWGPVILPSPSIPPNPQSHPQISHQSPSRSNPISQPDYLPSTESAPLGEPWLKKGSPQASPQRPRLSSIFTDATGKGKERERPERRRRVSAFEDMSADVDDAVVQFDSRIRDYRSRLSSSALKRAATASNQLGTRYKAIFAALQSGQKVPNLLDVARWRKRRLEQWRIQESRKAADAAKERESRSLAPSPPPGRPFAWVAPLDTDPLVNEEEASSLDWLPYLASLHRRGGASTTTNGKKEMREWHVTAQHVMDYLQWRKTASSRDYEALTLSPNKNRSATDFSPSHIPRSSLSLPFSSFSRKSADGILRSPLAKQPLSKLNSNDGDINPERIPSPVPHVGRGMRISLPNSPIQSFGNLLAGPSSPTSQHDAHSFSSKFHLSPLLHPRQTNRHSSGEENSSRSSLSDNGRSGKSGSGGVYSDGGSGQAVHTPFQMGRVSALDLPSASDEELKPKSTRSAQSDSMRSGKLGLSPRAKWPRSSRDLVGATYGFDVETPKPLEDALTPRVGIKPDNMRAQLLLAPGLTTEETASSRKRREREEREAEEYNTRHKLTGQLAEQVDVLMSALQSTNASIQDFADIRQAVVATLGMVEQPLLPVILEALTPHSTGRSLFSIDHARDDAFYRRNLVDSFVASSDLPGSPLSRDLILETYSIDRVDIAAMASIALRRLRSEWNEISKEIQALKAFQDRLTNAVQDLNVTFLTTSGKVDTTYPELRQNGELSRYLSSWSESAVIPWLPPWAREALVILSPLIKVNLEIIGFVLRFVIPLWQMLPRSLQNLISLVIYVIWMVFVMVYRTFTIGYFIGHQLAQFQLVRTPVLKALELWSALTAQLRHYLRLFFALLAFCVFVYSITPSPPHHSMD